MDVQVIARGDVTDADRTAAQEQLARLERYVPGTLRGARAALVAEPNPRIPAPARAEAEVLLEGQPIRARAAAATMSAAIDEVAERLARNLRRHVDRLVDAKRIAPEAEPGEWRHGAWTPPTPATFRRPPEEREIVRRKTFTYDGMTVSEAAEALDALDHAFFLFHDVATGADAVIYRHADGRLALIEPPGAAPHPEPDLALEPNRFSGPVDLEAALTQMDELEHRFLFFVNAQTGRGNVLYVRYDGHYGLIEPVAHEAD